MAQLTTAGKLSGQNLFQYMGYMAKVGELATRYEWRSVMLYDHEYREVQAELGFPWGSDSRFLDRVLIPKNSTTSSSSPSSNMNKKPSSPAKGRERQGPFSPDGKEICRLFNDGQCRLGVRCKRSHICRLPGCGQAHPIFQHSSHVDQNQARQFPHHPKNV